MHASISFTALVFLIVVALASTMPVPTVCAT